MAATARKGESEVIGFYKVIEKIRTEKEREGAEKEKKCGINLTKYCVHI